MGCEICGKSSCTKSFHSVNEQLALDEVRDKIVDRVKSRITYKIVRLHNEEINGETVVSMDEVLSLIDDLN